MRTGCSARSLGSCLWRRRSSLEKTRFPPSRLESVSVSIMARRRKELQHKTALTTEGGVEDDLVVLEMVVDVASISAFEGS